MADEKTEQTVEQVEQTETQEQVDGTTEKAPANDQKVEQKDEKPGIVDRIAGMLKKAKEENNQDGGTDIESKTEGSETQGEAIPAEFVAAARKSGVFTSDEQIVEFASDYSDDELVGMVEDLTPAKKQEAPASETPGKVEQKSQEQSPAPQSEIAALKAELEALKQSVGESTKETQQQKATRQEQHANDVFDTLGKEWTEFGETAKLPKFPDGRYIPSSPQMKARVEVWGNAHQLAGALQVPWERAMKMAVNLYKGEHGDAHAKHAVIKDIKNNAKRLTAKRSSKQTEQVYESEDDRRADVVRQAARGMGVELD
jgi:hypothetical protein